MNYIVFDLEWNQSPGGKRYSVASMPFEIIEIGAVKLNDRLEPLDVFQRLIRPQIYRRLHHTIRNVIHMSNRELMDGDPFTRAAREFLAWCALGQRIDDEGYVVTDEENPRQPFYFCTWGNQDVMELQRNMNFYDMLDRLPGPVTYYDAQRLFGIQYENNPDVCRSLEYAIDYLEIEKGHGFHRALDDAHFTAMVMMKMSPEVIRENPSLDTYQHPMTRKEEIRITRPGFSEYISKEFVSKEKAVKDREILSTRCPGCGKAARRKVRWFTPNARTYYSISLCQEHGEVTGVLRLKKTDSGAFYADKTLKYDDPAEAEEIRRRREALSAKRKAKRKTGAKSEES